MLKELELIIFLLSRCPIIFLVDVIVTQDCSIEGMMLDFNSGEKKYFLLSRLRLFRYSGRDQEHRIITSLVASEDSLNNLFFKICSWFCSFHYLQSLANRTCQLKHSRAVHNFLNKANYWACQCSCWQNLWSYFVVVPVMQLDWDLALQFGALCDDLQGMSKFCAVIFNL